VEVLISWPQRGWLRPARVRLDREPLRLARVVQLALRLGRVVRLARVVLLGRVLRLAKAL
jgi:hypothetical protein